ncbi:MAG TPA: carbon-nitrogen hydrolase family protein [Chloroflexota bacterium]|nr:carbon-nitrogen hydrolase family protein [Chloroflexota bacterium]
MKLTVATCQFPVSADVAANCRYVLRQMRLARERGADIAHFPEACLSGYAGVDFGSYREIDWEQLREHTHEVLDLARQLELWLVLGSSHQLSGRHKPHNSLYVVNDRGEIVDRYDKRFCAGDGSPDPRTGDLANYSPGNHFSVFSIGEVRCGALICHDYRYPELYRAYKARGVDIVFHSYHAANVSKERMRAMRVYVGVHQHSMSARATLPGITMPASMVAAAAANHLWISCPNSSARESCWPSFAVRPDGVITGQLRLHVPGVLISTVDTAESLYDSTAAWRDRAMAGVLHSGKLVRDRRSTDRTRL